MMMMMTGKLVLDWDLVEIVAHKLILQQRCFRIVSIIHFIATGIIKQTQFQSVTMCDSTKTTTTTPSGTSTCVNIFE